VEPLRIDDLPDELLARVIAAAGQKEGCAATAATVGAAAATNPLVHGLPLHLRHALMAADLHATMAAYAVIRKQVAKPFTAGVPHLLSAGDGTMPSSRTVQSGMI
jgi:hypothetical protein